MNKKNLPVIIVAIVIAVATITAIVVGVSVKNSNKTDVPDPPVTSDETQPDNQETTDTDIPEIPSETKPSDTESEETSEDYPGDIHIDVEKPDGAPKPKEPFVEGEVVIIPGLKEVDEDETQN